MKPIAFGKETYVGDPVNAVRIFNEKQADELVLIDLGASEDPGKIPYDLIEEVSTEAFMPVAYGGGINSAEIAQRISMCGIEKVLLNSVIADSPHTVTEISNQIGAQSVVAAVDVKRKRFGGYQCVTHRARHKVERNPVEFAQYAVGLGAGEILVQSVDREGSFSGYDIPLIESIAHQVNVPVVALGGARGIEDFEAAFVAGAAGAAAGSTFVFHGKHRAVLITYPNHLHLGELHRLSEGK